MSWFQKYKPCLSFKELKIHFDSDYYSRHCLPWGITDSSRDALYRYSALPSLMPRTTYRALIVKDIPDKGEPMQLQRNKTVENWTTPVPKTKTMGQPVLPRPKKKVCFVPLPLRIQCQPRHHLNSSHPIQYLELSHMLYAYTTAYITAKTGHGITKTQIIKTMPPQHPTLHPLSACLMQGHRLRTVSKSQPRQASPTATLGEDQIHPNLGNIMNVCAVNFAQFCKQKSVKIIRIHMAELVELVK